MGVHDVGVARVERQWRLLPAGQSGAAPADADLPHRRSPFLSGLWVLVMP
jgi:NAD(P)H-nitrite reductase large subunit